MASTYSPNLRLELIGTGDQQGTWGATTNTNLGTLLEEAIGGYVSVTVTDGADTTLTTNNGTADQSRNMIINLAGALTAARNVICPAIEKLYVVKNATTGGYAVTFKVSGQTGVSIPNGATYVLYVNGTDAVAVTGTMANQLASAVAITGGTISGITDLAVADGGTGASTAANARTNLGLGTVSTQNANAVAITGGSIIANASSLSILDSDASNIMTLAVGSNLTANTTLTLTTGASSNRTLDISAANVTISTAGAALIDDADASAQRTTLGLGTVATQNANNVTITGGSVTGITDLAIADGGTGASDASAARTNLGLGTIATQNSNNVTITGGSVSGITDLAVADGGTGASDAGTARTNLGLGTISTQNSNAVTITGGSISGITDLAVADGGTGASDAATARTNLGLGSISTQNANAVAITGGTIVANASGISIRDSDSSNVMTIAVGSNLTANTTLTLTTGASSDRTLDISAANVTISTAGAALIDDADASAQRTTLGLGTIATQNSNNVTVTGGSITGITDLALADGGTGTSLSDPNANAVLGWNDTAGAMTFLTAGTGISINATSNTISSTITAGGNYAMQVYTNTTPGGVTWTKPSGLVAVKVTVVGGGGGRPPSPTEKGGSGGGGTAIEYIPAASIPGPVTVTVGAGGPSAAPGAGGTSSFGAFCSATSGAVASDEFGGAGGAGTGGTVNLTGDSGGETIARPGGTSPSPPGPARLTLGGRGGSSMLGGGGAPSIEFDNASVTQPFVNANAGTTYGGGASGIFQGTGAAGFQGIVIVEEFY